MGWVMGFEPTNTGTTIRCLRPLGDTHHILMHALLVQTQRRNWYARRDSSIKGSLRQAVAINTPPACCDLECSSPGEMLRSVLRSSCADIKKKLGRQEGLEPPTYCLEGSCSIQLSYWRIWMERVTGIGPAYPAWKAGVLPLNYTRSYANPG